MIDNLPNNRPSITNILDKLGKQEIQSTQHEQTSKKLAAGLTSFAETPENEKTLFQTVIAALTAEHSALLSSNFEETEENFESIHDRHQAELLKTFDAQTSTCSLSGSQHFRILLETELNDTFVSLVSRKTKHAIIQKAKANLLVSYTDELETKANEIKTPPELVGFEMRKAIATKLRNETGSEVSVEQIEEGDEIFENIQENHVKHLQSVAMEIAKTKCIDNYLCIMECMAQDKTKVNESPRRHEETQQLVIEELVHNFSSHSFLDIKETKQKDKFLDSQFDKCHNKYKQSISANTRIENNVVQEAVEAYKKEMGKCFQFKPYLKPNGVQQLHDQVSISILERFAGQKFANAQKLKEAIDNTLNDIQAENKINWAEDPAIGIDLGTTFSCVSVYWQGKLTMIPNSTEDLTTPSFVYIDTANNRAIVGSVAKHRAFKNPEATVFDSKRLIGRNFSDPDVQRYIKFWPFVVTDDGKDFPVVSINQQIYRPEIIAARILANLKHDAEVYLGRKVTKAVITVPAHFGDSQKEATIVAGIIAGLQVLSIVTEPVAASLAYKLQFPVGQNLGAERRVLIFDLGGGTFDVAVAKTGQVNLEVLALGGDAHLGEDDFDKAIVEYCAKEFKKSTGIDVLGGMNSQDKNIRDDARRRIRRLQRECEKKKIMLSTSMSVEVVLDRIVDDKDLLVTLTRTEFETINKKLFERTLSIVKRTIKDAKCKVLDIEDVILVGGSTRIPKIQQMLKELFGGKELRRNINPDEAVAQGAGMLAAILKGHVTKDSKDYSEVQDITHLPIGIKTINGEFAVIVPKGSKIPATETSDFTTTYDKQTNVRISVFEGENVVANKNRKLGDMILTGVPPKPKGKETITVEMNITKQGILHVTAKSKGSGSVCELEVKENKQRLDEATIEKYMEDAVKRVENIRDEKDARGCVIV